MKMNDSILINNMETSVLAIYRDIKWVWFDLDDTLFDFKYASGVALGQVYEQFGLNRFFPTVEAWVDVYHRFNTQMWTLYNAGEIDSMTLRYRRFMLPLLEGGASTDEAESLVWPLDERYLNCLGQINAPVDSALQLIDNLRSNGFKIGILSNGFRQVQHHKLATLGLTDRIDCVVLSDDIGVNKPARELFDYALRRADTTARCSLMVGDNPDTDIRGAINAGWRAVLYAPGTKHPQTAVGDLSQLMIHRGQKAALKESKGVND